MWSILPHFSTLSTLYQPHTSFPALTALAAGRRPLSRRPSVAGHPMQPLTRTVATAFARMGVPAELVAWVLADIARPQGVNRLLTACTDVRLACLEFQARPDAPMVVQVASSSTEVTRPAFVLLDLPVELVACVLSKLERPEDVNRLLVTCQSIRRACLALQGGEWAGADAPMVVQVVSISREVARPHAPFRRPPDLCLAVKNGWVALLPLL